MSQNFDHKRLSRIELNVRQALDAARVLRQGDMLGQNPFHAMGASVALTALVTTMEPEWSKAPGWSEHLFPRLTGHHYGWIVAMDLPSVLQMAHSERNFESCEKCLRQAIGWAKQVAEGDEDAVRLDEIAEVIGTTLLKAFMGESLAPELTISATPARAEALFDRALRAGAQTQDAESGLNLLGAPELVALVEMVAVSMSVQMYRLDLIDFKSIGRWNTISGVLRPQTLGGMFLQNWLQKPRVEIPFLGPIAALQAVKRGWAKEIDPTFDVVARNTKLLAANLAAAMREGQAEAQSA